MKNTRITIPPRTTLVVQMSTPFGRSVLCVPFQSESAGIAGTADWMLPARTGPKITIATITSKPTKPAIMVFIGPEPPLPPSRRAIRNISLLSTLYQYLCIYMFRSKPHNIDITKLGLCEVF